MLVTSDQLGLEKPEKLSYAAVTFSQGSTMTSPVVVTSMQSMPGHVNTVPILSPQGIVRQVPTPHSRVFPTCIPGLGVPTLNNYIVYSLTAPQPASLIPNHVLHGDHPTYSAQQQLRDIPRSSTQYLSTFQPPSWGHSSPQPGAYPPPQVQTQDPFPRLGRGNPGHRKSPQTPAHQSLGRASPQYPPPRSSSAQQATIVQLAVPPVTSYPPPPFSPISQFSSPPPPVLNKLQPPPPSRIDSPCADVSNAPTRRNGQKESTSDASDRLRSVSYSSDKFPPSSLNRARMNHQDQLPLSPCYTMSGVVPLPANVDTSVPPPSLPTPPPSVSPPLSFNMAKKRAWRTQRSPRVSVSEIHDMSSPQPVHTNRAANAHIKFSLASRRDNNVFDDNVYNY